MQNGRDADNMVEGFLWQEHNPQHRNNNNNRNVQGINNERAEDGLMDRNIPLARQVEADGNNGRNDEGWNDGRRNTLDGGSAVENKTSSQCEMSVYLLFSGPSPLGIPSNHPVYSAGSTVEIALDRSTKLLDLFQRYCTFANNHTDNQTLHLDPKDLEFSHCFVLEHNQSIDTSALMHKDKIRVRAYDRHEKQLKIERLKMQCEIDKNYFDQLRVLMPDLTPSPVRCDVVFHCIGRITDDKGRTQEVLHNHVRGHSAVLSRRCPWLKLKIALAKMIFRQQHEYREPRNVILDHERSGLSANDGNELNIVSFRVGSNAEISNHGGNRSVNELDHEDNILMGNNNNIRNEQQRFHDQNIVMDDEINPDIHVAEPWRNHAISLDGQVNNNEIVPPSASAHAVEDDEEDTRVPNIVTTMGFCESHQLNAAIVTLNHPPEAVKILLEYCYTNRVISLGYEAYVKSFKPLDPVPADWLVEKYSSFISPFNSNKASAWPQDGIPMISLPIALAGIQLSEEASLPRLSLMCEIAASVLVTTTSALDVLGFCEVQQRKSGNGLTILRRAVMMNHVFMDGPKSILHLSNNHCLNRTLRDKKDIVVPGLLCGIKDLLQDVLGPKMHTLGHPHVDALERKAILLNAVQHYFDQIDTEDRKARSRERKGGRREKRSRRILKEFSDNIDDSNNKAIIYDMDDEGNWEQDTVLESHPKIIRLKK